MNIKAFSALLEKSHPGAVYYRAQDYSGLSAQNGIAITYTPGGKVYHYRGTFQAIAINLKLVQEYVIWADDRDVCGSELSEAAAIAKCAELTARDARQCGKLGNTPRKYGYK